MAEIEEKLEKPLVQPTNDGLAGEVDLRFEQVPVASTEMPAEFGDVLITGEDLKPEAVSPFTDATSEQVLSNEEVRDLYNRIVAENGEMLIKKGYYEANLMHIDERKYPHGILLSSLENPMVLKESVTINYGPGTDSITLEKGTMLPPGVQLVAADGMSSANGDSTLSGNVSVLVPAEGVMVDGQLIKPGGTITGGAMVHDGQTGKPGAYLITRATYDDNGNRAWDVYTNKNLDNWLPVDGKPGVFYPNPAKAEVLKAIRIPEGALPEGIKTLIQPSWGNPAAISTGIVLIPEPDGSGKFRIVAARPALETYMPINDAAVSAMNLNAEAITDKFPGAPVLRAEPTREAFEAGRDRVFAGDVIYFHPLANNSAADALSGRNPFVSDLSFNNAIKDLQLSPSATKESLIAELSRVATPDELARYEKMTPEALRSHLTALQSGIHSNKIEVVRGAGGVLLLVSTVTGLSGALFN